MTDAELFEAFAAYQRARSFSAHTVRRREISLGRFARHMAPRSVGAARWQDAQEFLELHRAPATRKAYRSDLAAFYNWACRRDLLATNPMPLVDPIRTPKSMPRPASVDAIAVAYAKADGDVQTMILLGALAGLRRSEIAALDRADLHLDVEPPVIHVRHGKGAKDRVVPIHPMLLDNLRRRDSWLYRPRARRYNADRVGKLLAAALSDGERRITGHQLRHFFGTEAARTSGGNVVLVGLLMGHAHPNTTMGYIGWNPVEGAKVVAQMTAPPTSDELAEVRSIRRAS